MKMTTTIIRSPRALLVSSIPWLFLLVLAALSPWVVSAIPRLGTVRRISNTESSSSSSSAITDNSNNVKTFFYTQTLDHFNYRPDSYATFQQRYLMNSKYWGGANTSSPIFVYLGAEAPIDGDVYSIGFLPDHAPQFKALIVYIEHRYYGQSVPFESRKEAFQNASTLGYFSSSQALVDYAEVVISLKQNLSAETSPVIVIGGSYGGMLASWFRLKFPHVALGALASSAPIRNFEDLVPDNKGYYSVVSKDFREASKSCYNTIRRSWSIIDKIAATSNGLAVLSRKFKTCFPLNAAFELKDFLDSIYAESAQYDVPPEYPVTIVCKGIDGVMNGTGILNRIHAGVVAYQGKRPCYDMKAFNHPSETNEGWGWQTCSEMVMPIGHGDKNSMFQAEKFNQTQFSESCLKKYGVPPRPHWILTEFGGRDIKLVLRNFASNIIFSNGLRDPYSTGGVLESISDSVVAVKTANGSHCLDILFKSSYDPKWLVEQRNTEVKIIKSWIKEYYSMLMAERN